MDFAAKVDTLMQRKGLTQTALGAALGVTQRAVGGWLSGAKPHRRRAVELAEYLGVSVNVLLDDEKPLELEEQDARNLLKLDRGKKVPFSVVSEEEQVPYGARLSVNRALTTTMEAFNNLPSSAQIRVARSIITAAMEALRNEHNVSK